MLISQLYHPKCKSRKRAAANNACNQALTAPALDFLPVGNKHKLVIVSLIHLNLLVVCPSLLENIFDCNWSSSILNISSAQVFPIIPISIELFNDPTILGNFQSLLSVCDGYYPTFDSHINFCVWKPFNYRIIFLVCQFYLVCMKKSLGLDYIFFKV